MLNSILNPELWIEGLTTMLIGMGIVFSFLIVLVFAIRIMVGIISYLNKIFPPEVKEDKQQKRQVCDNGAEIAIAIAMAKNQA